MTTTNTDGDGDGEQQQRRADLLARLASAGLTEQDLALLGAPAADTRLSALLPGALERLGRDHGRSYLTWAPYLQILTDGLPDTCPCPCLSCAAGPCPCPAGQHAETCRPPADLPYPCTARYGGVGDRPVADIGSHDIEDLAWWVRRRALRRTVVHNAARAAKGLPAKLSDGRGAAEAAIQACRWLFTYLRKQHKTTGVLDNVALDVKLPRRQERAARSMDVSELLEVYRVAVTTGRDPELDGLLLRHQLIQGVRRSGLLDATAGGINPDRCEITYYDRKGDTHRTRPSTRQHVAALVAHIVDRGPRLAAPPDAPEQLRRSGIPAIEDDSPVFYRHPIDVFDEHGYLLHRTTRPVTRKHIESLFTRIKAHLPWASQRGLRPHDMRHSSARLVYRAADDQMAQLHLGHEAGSTTDIYLKEHYEQLRQLKEELFGQHDPDDEAGPDSQ